MRLRLLAIAVGTILLLGACTDRSRAQQAPAIDNATSAELSARSIWRACTDVVCQGAPILVDGSTADSVRAELATFTDEIRYVTTAEIESLAAFGERFSDGATLFESSRPNPTMKPDVVGVDVSIYNGPGDLFRRTYLFRWDGATWADVSPDAVDVAVTSAVS